MEAELRVGFGGLEEAYVSKVSGRPFESVTAEAAEEAALFKSLRTTCELWSYYVVRQYLGLVVVYIIAGRRACALMYC